MESSVISAQAGFTVAHISVQTQHARQFVDITDEVRSRIAGSSIREGIAVVSSRHTTAAIVVNEHEPELLKDLDRLLNELAPDGHAYAHDAVPCGPDEYPNGHAHCQALLLNTSASIPIPSGDLHLGRYQRIFLVELDQARARHVTLVVLGV